MTAADATATRRRNPLSDSIIVMGRELRPVISDPFSLVAGMVQPLFFLLLFGPLIAAGAPSSDGSTWSWFVPGILVMTALFGTAGTGSNLQFDLQGGAHERLLVTPLSRSSLFIGRALKEFVPLVAQAVIVVLVMIPFGFRPNPAGGLLGLFPLMILSGMLLPLDDGPAWMRIVSQLNPLTHVVDAERDLFAGRISSDVGLGFLAAAVTAALGLVLGLRALRTSTS